MQRVERPELRVRATNYFALHSLYKNPREAADLWDRLCTKTDLSVPIGSEVAALLGRLDIDGNHLRELYDEALKAASVLKPSDHIFEWRTPGYPQRLSELVDAPRFIFVRSPEPALDEPALAVVGTRHPSDEGRRRARKLAYLLAKRDITVVSGLALGIDTAAHEGALDVGGRTVAVIGTPLNRSYPRANAELQRHIGRVGAVLSQFHPSGATTPLSFPLRNATMSGLCIGTVIIEASETSGALIQAQHCIANGRRLFIPKSAVENPSLAWPRKYIERGAVMFSTIEELIERLEAEQLLTPARDGVEGDVEILDLRATGG